MEDISFNVKELSIEDVIQGSTNWISISWIQLESHQEWEPGNRSLVERKGNQMQKAAMIKVCLIFPFTTHISLRNN